MSQATAWILPVSDDLSTAVGEFELVHLLPESPVLFEVPRAPAYCRTVLVWQDLIVPLMDLAARFGLAADLVQRKPEPGQVGIVAYRAEGTAQPAYGALRLHAIPWRCTVDDAWACRLPPVQQAWASYAHSCFRLEGSGAAIPVLKLNRLFSS